MAKYGAEKCGRKNGISWAYDLCFRFSEVLNGVET